MSLKWTGGQSESGILRKSEFKEKKEDLFVFGYSCKLFRDDDKALHIDQGKHLIPWMGDETLKIDRYDARGALHDLTRLEAPPGGYDWRVELTRGELDVEQLCDEERYRALHTDEDEEEMYKEEELKRLHAAGYGQVGFNYDAPAEPEPPPQPAEVDEEPFIPTPAFRALLPIDTVFPETLKQNAIIEKTAKFIASQGAQMEILIKAKQGDNAQFKFLNRDSQLNPYYTALIGLVKAGKWPEKKVEVVEEKTPENEDYLHPSLASTVIESAPAIPSIHYKPSADCDYTMLISKMRGEGEGGSDEEARGDVPPPGTEPPAQRPPTAEIYRAPVMYTRGPDGNHVDPTAPPVNPAHYQQYATYYHQYLAQEQQKQIKKEPPPPLKSTGLSLMKNYNTDSDSDMSDYDDSSSTDSRGKTSIITPPEDVQIVIDKMASYVARNGDEFADIVRSKNDPRFTFLEPENIYHAYYKRLMQQKRGIDVNGKEKKRKTSAPVSFSIKKLKEPDPILPKPALPYESSSDDDSEKPSDKQEERREKEEFRELPKVAPHMFPINNIPPVVVYKIDGQLHNDLPLVKTIEAKPVAKITPQPVIIPVIKETPKKEEILVLPETTVNKPVVEEVKNTIVDNNVKKIETERDSPQKQEGPSTRDSPHMRESPNSRDSPYNRDSPFVKDSPHKRDSPPKRNSPHKRDSPHRRDSTQKRDSPHRRDSPHMRDSSYRRESPHKRDNPPKRDSPYRRESPHRRDSPYIRETHKRDKKKTRDRKREHRSKSESRESRRIERTSADGEKKREKDKIKENERERKKIKLSKDDLENEIISLEDNSDDLIDLTGDQSDSKGEGETEAERAKQQERRRRAAEFLKKVGVDPSAAALPTSSLASAMVDTLESIRKKKAEEEEKRRRRDKRRHRDRRDYEDESERSHRKSKRRKYKSSEDNDESDYDGSKKKKRKKDRKHSSKNKRKRRRELDADEEQPPPINIDLTNTLKELRTCSPTKDLVLQDLDDTQHSFARQESSDEEVIRDKRRKKESRQYSEGEWSSDSEGDSKSTTSKKDE